MSSDDREALVEDLRVIDAAIDRILARGFTALTIPEHFNGMQHIETVRRRLPVIEHGLINGILSQAIPAEIGGRLNRVLADRLRITPGEASRRIAEAADLGERRAMTGQPLEPVLAATAAGQRAGDIGAGHVREIRGFLKSLPCWVDAATRERAEHELARLAARVRPDELRVLGRAMADAINPDGIFDDADRARRRGITLGRQGVDGMSPISGFLTPEARASWDAVLAKLAAPGMCNPADQSPTVDGQPDEQAARWDMRSTAQRTHDGLSAALRAVLASGELGQHHGLPVSIVVTTTLHDLESATGTAHTGGGSRLPISDVIRMAAQAHHYLAVFDHHTKVPLYLAKTRIATPGQRLVLHAVDRGCSRPGCTVPGYACQVHHVDEWAHTHRTDIDDLTFACKPDHKLLEHGWKTRKRADGTTEWIPPPHLDFGKPRTNGYHHPERYLADNEDNDDGDP